MMILSYSTLERAEVMADELTKPLGKDKFAQFVKMISRPWSMVINLIEIVILALWKLQQLHLVLHMITIPLFFYTEIFLRSVADGGVLTGCVPFPF
jgi:hypothetical protein